MITDKTRQLKQDLLEVRTCIEELEPYLMNNGLRTDYKDLKEAIETLEEHLKDHIEDVENFVGRIN